jgi:hypothetical protein
MNALVERTIAAPGGMKRWNDGQPDNTANRDLLVVSIGLSNIDLKRPGDKSCAIGSQAHERIACQNN